MKQRSLTKVAIAASTFACAALLSFGWSEQGGVSLSVESAQARVGRPLTPVSVAGVARRQYRRGAYGYGAGVVGAGVVGTAAAVAATSPDWGWGGDPNYTGTGYYGGGRYHRAGWGGGSYYGARAAYYGGAPAATVAAEPWSLWAAYHADGPGTASADGKTTRRAAVLSATPAPWSKATTA
jgi:hypothetical protein